MIPKSVAKQSTNISWCDMTANAWIGCTRIPASSGGRSGCDVCYAETFGRNRMGVTWGPGEARRPVAGYAARMRRLNRLAAETGMPFSVFALSLGDWLDPEVPQAMRTGLIDVIGECGSLTWLLLTHRPHLARRLAPTAWLADAPANIWPGVTVDHPAHAFRWRQHADAWRASPRCWISAEPLTGSLAACDLTGAATIIMGGASGVTDPTWAFDPAWVGEMVERHGADRVYFKQHGDYRDGVRVGKRAAGNDIDGRTFERTPWPLHASEIAKAARRQDTTNR